MANVHPSAIVDSRAELADDVEVGPGCVIEGPVRIGSGCRLYGQVYLHGNVTLGQANTLFPFVCIGFEPQDRSFDGGPTSVVSGVRNVLRESVTVHRSSHPDRRTTLGNDNYLMNNAHVGHDALIGNHCTLGPGALVGGHARLQDGVFIGGNGGVHQHCTLGRMSFLGGVTAVTHDTPPFGLCFGLNTLIGVNLVGLRRSGVTRPAIDAVKAAYKTLYLSGHSNPVAADRIEQSRSPGEPGAEMMAELAAFIRQSKHGMVPYAPRKRRRVDI